MYGGANETRYANDIEDLAAAVEGPRIPQMRTVNAAYFQSTRLLGLQTRNSAAYKGVMALVFRESCLDFDRRRADDQAVKSMETPAGHPPHLPARLLREGRASTARSGTPS